MTPDQGARESDPDDPGDLHLAEALEHCLCRFEQGRPVAGEPIPAANPKVADRLRECLPALELLQRAISAPPAEPGAPALPVGRRIADFTVLRELGRGGMGVVYQAEQGSLQRQVALKVLPAHLTLRPETVQRFRREAATAARLHHPGIVPILAVGEDDGTHWFAMELVEGAPLDRVLDLLRARQPEQITGLSLADAVSSTSLAPRGAPAGEALAAWGRTYVEATCRIGLQVADALACAHAAGVVHRDVKPSNIIVRPDGRAVLTDFGLAWEQGLPSLTRTGEMPGTPYYLAPEQVWAARGRVDQRTDVFSLGVTLYEMLCLRRPFTGDDVQEVLASIRHSEPADPQRWNRLLSSDLATIVLTAIEKDPDRRYQTAAAFAEDLRAFLEYRPIAARRATLPRRALRWARRRPLEAAFAACVLLGASTVVGLGVYAQAEAALARKEAKRASTVLRLVEDMLASADPHESNGKDYRLSQVLDDFDLELGTRLQGEPEVEASVHRLMGNAYRGLGLLAKAEQHLSAALAKRRLVFGGRSVQVVESLADQALLLHDQGQHARAGEILDEARSIASSLPGTEEQMCTILGLQADLARHLGLLPVAAERAEQAILLRRRHFGDSHLQVADGLGTLGTVRHCQGRLREAEELHRQALRMAGELLHDENLLVSTLRNNLGATLEARGRLDEAEQQYRQAFAVRQRLLRDEHPMLATSLNNIAGVLLARDRLGEAEAMYKQALAMRQRMLGDEHPHIAESLQNLACVLQRQGRLAEAQATYEQALAMLRRLPGTEGPAMARTLCSLGVVLGERGRIEDAARTAEQALEMRRRMFGEEHADFAQSLESLGLARQLQHLPAEAERLHRQALEIRRRLLGDDSAEVASSLNGLGAALMDLGRLDDAEQALQRALAVNGTLYGEDNLDSATNLANLAGVALRRRRLPDAEALLERALAIHRKLLPVDGPGAATALNNLGGVLLQMGKLPEAERATRQALEIRQRLHSGESLDIAASLAGLANVLRGQRRYAEAEAAQRDSLAMHQRLLGNENREVADDRSLLARLLQDQGRLAEAERLYREALTMRRDVAGESSPEHLASFVELAVVLDAQDQLDEAVAVCQRWLDQARRQCPPGDLQVAGPLAMLGQVLLRQRRYADAEPFLREGLEIRKEKLSGHWRTWNTMSMLGAALAGLGRHEEAEPLLREGWEKLDPPPDAAFRRRAALERLIWHYEAWGRPEQADPLRKLLQEYPNANR